jgi:hypothetical protein
MGPNTQKMFMYCFTLFCALLTVSFVVYWFYQFTLNEDLSVVKYKEFQRNNDKIFHTVSLCLGNPFLKEKLDEYGVDETTYLAFLEGNAFSNEMMNINFSRVTIDIVDYIKGYNIRFKNDTSIVFDAGLTLQQKEMLTFPSFIGFSGSAGRFYKCFALQIPDVIDLYQFNILLSNHVFEKGIRPAKHFF